MVVAVGSRWGFDKRETGEDCEEAGEGVGEAVGGGCFHGGEVDECEGLSVCGNTRVVGRHLTDNGVEVADVEAFDAF